MVELRTAAEFKERLRAGRGFIYNDFAGHGAAGAEMNVLHYADCETLSRATTSVRKFHAATLPEAVSWLESNRGAEGDHWKRCGICFE